MAVPTAEVLRAALRRFVEVHGRWPRSLDELAPFDVRGLGTATVVGFGQATEDELCLRYAHRRGKAVVRIRRRAGNPD